MKLGGKRLWECRSCGQLNSVDDRYCIRCGWDRQAKP